eukprot:5252215-Amphidinium_carterae.1
MYAFASLCQSLPAEWRKQSAVPLALPCSENMCKASAMRFGHLQVDCATARPLFQIMPNRNGSRPRQIGMWRSRCRCSRIMVAYRR